MGKPFSSFMIVQDPRLIGGSLTSSSSTGGLQASVGAVATSSSGHLSLFAVGTPTNAGSYNLRIQESGNLYESTFAWKKAALADDYYLGEPDQRHMITFEDPWCSTPDSTALPSSPNGGKAKGATACFLSSTNKEYLYRTISRAKIQVRHRSVSEDGPKSIYNWSESTIDIQDVAGYGVENASWPDAPIDVAAYQGDTIFLITAFDQELHLYKSTDGTSFELVCENILSRFGGRRAIIFGLRLAISGNYIRILYTAYNKIFTKNPELKLYGFVSTNQGTSFIQTDDGDIDPGIWPSSGASRCAYDFAPFDENGTFILYNRHGVNGLHGFIGKTTSAFVRYANLTILGGDIYETPYRPYVCKTQKEFVVLYSTSCKRSPYLYSEGTYTNPSVQVFNEYKKAIIRLNSDPTTELPIILGNSGLIGSFSDNSGMTGFKGCFRNLPLRGKLFQTGSGYAFYANLLGATDTSPLDPIITWNDESVGPQENNVWQSKEEQDDFRVTANSGIDASVYISFQQWDVSPIRDMNLGNMVNYSSTQSWPLIHQPKGPLYQPQWNSFCGSPDSNPAYGNARTPWVRLKSATLGSTYKWGVDYLTQMASIGTGKDIFKFEDPTSVHASSPSTPAATRYGQNPLDFQGKAASPVSNWGFIPKANGSNLGNQCYAQPHGASFQWECRVDNSATSVTGISIQSYLTVGGNPFLSRMQLLLGNVSIYNDKVVYNDLNADGVIFGTSVPLLTLTPTGYGAEPFKDNWWEFRLSSVPWNSYGADNLSTLYMQLQCRVVGSTNWTISNWFNPGTENGPSGSERQVCAFGMFDAKPGDKAYWRNFQVLKHNNAGQFWINRTPTVGLPDDITDRLPLNDIRGKLCTPNPAYLEKGQKVVWGGVGAEQADSYDLATSYVYDAKNVMLPSPRIGYRTADKSSLTDVDIVLQTKNANYSFMHDGIGILNTNSHLIDVSYSDDNVSYGSAQSIDTSVNRGKVSSANNNILTVEFNGKNTTDQMYSYDSAYNSSQKRSYYIRFDGVTGVAGLTTNQRLKIKQNVGSQIVLEDSIDCSGITAGLSFTVCSDSVYKIYDSRKIGKYMKITMKEVNLSPETFGRIGSVIAGVTIPFSTPLNWNISDSEKPTSTVYKSRGAITWGYSDGPSVRTVSGNMVGDVYSQLRTTIKNSLRSLANYDIQPVLLVLDDNRNRDPDNFIYGRVANGSETNADGWYWDEKSLFWRPIGDMSLSIVEVV